MTIKDLRAVNCLALFCHAAICSLKTAPLTAAVDKSLAQTAES